MMERLLHITGLILVNLAFTSLGRTDEGGYKVAIIGAGIGGASSAYFLNNLMEDKAKIDVFEHGEIGGRLATVTMNGREYESGGSIIHPSNKYMAQFTQLLGLKEKARPGGRLAIFDGDSIVFDGSSKTWLMVAQLLWHYGWDILSIQNYVKDLLQDFSRIYDHQSNGYSFTTVDKLLASMSHSFPEKLEHSVHEEFRDRDFSEKFISELVRGGLRSNYGQNEDIQAFVGAVSMAGVEPGLWSVHGGNKLVPIHLLESMKSNLSVIKSKVEQISLESDGRYLVSASNGQEGSYDYVIVATPLHDDLSGIEFSGFSSHIGDFKSHFHRTVATFITGYPNASKFGYSDVKDFPEALFTSIKEYFFNSIGRQSPVDYEHAEREQYMSETPVYKVFSRDRLTVDQIKDLFSQVDDMKVVDWKGAYPHYISQETDMPSFKLHDNLFYVNAIEIAASAMEMSAIGGYNVALLLYNTLNNLYEHIDVDPTQISAPKDEF